MQSNEYLRLAKAKEPDAKLLYRFISLGMRSGYDECNLSTPNVESHSHVQLHLGVGRRECCVTFRTDWMYIQQDLQSSYLPMCDCWFCGRGSWERECRMPNCLLTHVQLLSMVLITGTVIIFRRHSQVVHRIAYWRYRRIGREVQWQWLARPQEHVR